MRGKVSSEWQDINQYGITPAYAGKRDEKLTLQQAVKDHPRLCGEKKILNVLSCSLIGSPPPMRGKAAHNSAGIL